MTPRPPHPKIQPISSDFNHFHFCLRIPLGEDLGYNVRVPSCVDLWDLGTATVVFLVGQGIKQPVQNS
jgi:hypothetical protein